MAVPAESAISIGDDPGRVARELGALAERVGRPSGALVFAAGTLAAGLPALAQEIARAAPGLPLLLVPGAGVLTEKGEVEERSAAALLVWRGGRSEAIAIDGHGAEELGDGLARLIGDRAARTTPAVIAFVRPEGFGPQALEPLAQTRGAAHVFGAGIAGAENVFAIDADGRVQSGGAAALFVRGLSPPVIRSSPACRLLMPLRRITETRGALVVSVESEPALDVLSAVGRDLPDQPLVFAVLAPEATPGEASRPELVVRGIQGVDPVRRALLVSDEVREGMRLAFAVKDGIAARDDLETVARDAQRALAGAAPRFGVYVNCAGRGASLYGAQDVDTRILRSRFGDVPIAGMMSSFEIAPYDGRPALKLYTGVLALFTVPS
jgi:small ligand-binding sensory domain FIST